MSKCMLEKIFVIKTVGGSMRPLLLTNKTLFVASCNKESILLPGDIVVYRIGDGNTYMLHRIYFLTRKRALICSDAGVVSPHWVNRENIIGKIENNAIFSKGVIGLFYSVVCSTIFTILRYFKNKMLGIWRNLVDA
jgi:signal peptidase I